MNDIELFDSGKQVLLQPRLVGPPLIQVLDVNARGCAIIRLWGDGEGFTQTEVRGVLFGRILWPDGTFEFDWMRKWFLVANVAVWHIIALVSGILLVLLAVALDGSWLMKGACIALIVCFSVGSFTFMHSLAMQASSDLGKVQSLLRRAGEVMSGFRSFVALTAVLILAVSVVAVLPAWLLWNWLVPQIFGLPEISFLECFGLLLLSGIFLGVSPKLKLQYDD